MKRININLCRISRRDSGLYLDVIIDTDVYKVTSLEVTNLYTPDTIWQFAQALGNTSGKRAFSIPLHQLGDAGSSIYKLTIKGELANDTIEESAYVSDVEFMYECLLSELNNLEAGQCEPVSDDLIRKYLLLYGHTLAMSYGDVTHAEYFFNKMKGCGNKCQTLIKTCNCHG